MEQLSLIVRRAPAALDDELDAILFGIPCGTTQGTDQTGIEVGDGRVIVSEDRDIVRNNTIGSGRARQRARHDADERNAKQGNGRSEGEARSAACGARS